MARGLLNRRVIRGDESGNSCRNVSAVTAPAGRTAIKWLFIKAALFSWLPTHDASGKGKKPMIRLQLRCVHGDYFDAWFGDLQSFAAQATKGQVVCPHCGEIDVAEAPPLKPGLYPDLSEDQARQMSCDTRRMLSDWMARGQTEAVCETLAGQASYLVPASPPPPMPDVAAEPAEPEPRRMSDAATPGRMLAYDC